MKLSKSTRIIAATVLLMLALAAKSSSARAESDEHDHKTNSEHGHDHEHGHKDDHDDAKSEASEHGFSLTPEALKNFGLRTVKLEGTGPWTLPTSSVLYSGEEINLFRQRDGLFKRIDFKTVRKTKTEITVSSKDLNPGDQVVIEGLGFLRVAELAASGGVEHGHSH